MPYDKLSGSLVVERFGHLLQSLGRPAVLLVHSMAGAYGWKLLESYGDHITALVAVAPAPMGNIQPEPVVIRETANLLELQLFAGGATISLDPSAPFIASRPYTEAKLIGKSKRFPRAHSDEYAASLVGVPPQLLLERTNIRGRQLKVQDTRKLAGKRVLVMVGTDDLDHPVSTDKPIADWLASHGARIDFLALADRGIEGNGHMLMLETNSDQVADVILDWLDQGKL